MKREIPTALRNSSARLGKLRRLACALVPLVVACGGESAARPVVATPPIAPKGQAGPLCEGLRDRFIGLPAAGSPSDEASAPLVGRWWVRTCALEYAGTQVRLHVAGPAWYWVDDAQDGVRLQQEVALAVETTLTGSFEFGMRHSVASLWFRPDADADVRIEPIGDIDLRGDTVWGSLLRRLPFVPVESNVRERIAEEGSAELQAKLRHGFTITYDIRKGQADAALGILPRGQVPMHPFADSSAWQANERQLLFPGGGHVTGPLAPGAVIPIDLRVERGQGLTYRAVCAEELAPRHPCASEKAAAGLVCGRRPTGGLTGGEVTGRGLHRVELNGLGCPWYLVTTTLGSEASLVSLRVREPQG